MKTLRKLRKIIIPGPALWLLAWTQRHTLALWGRSLKSELKRGLPPDPGRMKRLVGALAKVTGDQRLSNTPALRSLRVEDDVVVADAEEHWEHRDTLATVLSGLNHVNDVRFGTPTTDMPQAVASAGW